jgi:hypothetical protein
MTGHIKAGQFPEPKEASKVDPLAIFKG